MTNSKACTKCGEEKELDLFYNTARYSDGKSCWCKVCQDANRKKNHTARPFNKPLLNARRRAKDKDVPFNITEEYLESIWTGVCPVFNTALKMPMQGTMKEHFVRDKPSLDRIIPEKGYVVGNVVWISNRANTIKFNANAAEIQAVATWLQQTEEEIKKHETD